MDTNLKKAAIMFSKWEGNPKDECMSDDRAINDLLLLNFPSSHTLPASKN